MNIELCSFSGHKIYPGHGKTYVRTDNKTFKLINGKHESHFLNGKKPSKFQWTSFYRRIHKKDASKEVAKKRTKRIAKPLRLISGVTEQMLQDLRNKALSNRGAKLEAPKGEAANDKTRSKDSRKKSATTAKFDHKAATKAPQPLGKQQTRPAVMRGNPQQKR